MSISDLVADCVHRTKTSWFMKCRRGRDGELNGIGTLKLIFINTNELSTKFIWKKNYIWKEICAAGRMRSLTSQNNVKKKQNNRNKTNSNKIVVSGWFYPVSCVSLSLYLSLSPSQSPFEWRITSIHQTSDNNTCASMHRNVNKYWIDISLIDRCFSKLKIQIIAPSVVFAFCIRCS